MPITYKGGLNEEEYYTGWREGGIRLQHRRVKSSWW